MSTISIHRTEWLRVTHNRFRRGIPPWRMTIKSISSSKKEAELSVQTSKPPTIPQLRPDGLRFDRLQPAEPEDRLEFGKFVAREAMLDEEYWTAAWLRAESHWEDRATERYVDNFKRKFAEQVGGSFFFFFFFSFNIFPTFFKATARFRSSMLLKEDAKGCTPRNAPALLRLRRKTSTLSVLLSRVSLGRLISAFGFSCKGRLSLGYLSQYLACLYQNPSNDLNYMQEKVRSQLFCSINQDRSNRYGYIANLCVAKSARRQGIACNMLRFAVQSASLSGVEQVYVHVHRNNLVAQELYQKAGFEIVETGQSESSKDTYLLQYTR